jgi:hypothetical protein
MNTIINSLSEADKNKSFLTVYKDGAEFDIKVSDFQPDSSAGGLQLENGASLSELPIAIADSGNNPSSLKISSVDSNFTNKVAINIDGASGYLHVRSTSGDYTTPLILLESNAGGAPADEVIESSYGVLASLKRMDGKYAYGNNVLSIGAFDSNSNFTGSVGIGLTGFETPQAALDIKSTTKGFLMPRMTEAEILLLTPYQGLQVYNTDINAFQYYDNTQWTTIGAPAPTYKVFTGLLTQTGNSNPQILIDTDNGNIVPGVTYQISNYQAGDDFTNIGAPSNANGVNFIATGNTATSWSGTTELNYNTGAPVVTILENTLGNVWFEYGSAGRYYLISNNLFVIEKTFISIQSQGNDNDTSNISSSYPQTSSQINVLINDSNGAGINDSIYTSLEIRIYN